MASFVLETATRTDVCTPLVADLNGGDIAIYTAAYALLLVTIPLAATCGTVSNGVLTLTTTAMNGNCGNPGIAAVFRMHKSGGSTIVASGDVGTSGATINLQNTNLAAGQNVSITSATITVPAGT